MWNNHYCNRPPARVRRLAFHAILEEALPGCWTRLFVNKAIFEHIKGVAHDKTAVRHLLLHVSRDAQLGPLIARLSPYPLRGNPRRPRLIPRETLPTSHDTNNVTQCYIFSMKKSLTLGAASSPGLAYDRSPALPLRATLSAWVHRAWAASAATRRSPPEC